MPATSETFAHLGGDSPFHRQHAGLVWCRGERVPFRIHGTGERRVRRSNALGDPRAVARVPGTSFEAPGVPRCGQLRMRTVVFDQRSALVRVWLREETGDRNLDLL